MCARVRACVCTCENNIVVICRSLPQETGRQPQRNEWQLNVFGERLEGIEAFNTYFFLKPTNIDDVFLNMFHLTCFLKVK